MQLNDIYPVAAILLMLCCVGYFFWAMLSKPKTSIFPKATHKAGFTTNAGAMGGTSEKLEEYKGIQTDYFESRCSDSSSIKPANY